MTNIYYSVQIHVAIKKVSKIRVAFTQKLKVHLLSHRSCDFQWLGMVGAFHNSSLTKKTRRLVPEEISSSPYPHNHHPFVISTSCLQAAPPHPHPAPQHGPRFPCIFSSPIPITRGHGWLLGHSVTSAKSYWEEQQGIKVSILIKLVKHGSIGSFGVSVSPESADSRHRVIWEKETGRVRGEIISVSLAQRFPFIESVTSHFS